MDASPAPSPAEEISIRHDVRPGDLGAVVHAHGAIYAREEGFDSTFEAYVAGPMAEFIIRRSDRERLWIAEIGPRLVGCIAIVQAGPDEAQLRWFLVDPAARGRGLGRRLVDAALDFCRRQRFARCHLWTVSRLVPAGNLYRSAGFRKVLEQPGDGWGSPVIEEKYQIEFDG